MNHKMLAACGAIALGTSMATFAQSTVNAPTDQKPTTTQLQYSSAFADYKPWQDLPAVNWRQVNDAVGAAAAKGGAPAAGAAPMPMPMPTPMPMPLPIPATKPAITASSPAATMPPMNHGGHAGHGGKP